MSKNGKIELFISHKNISVSELIIGGLEYVFVFILLKIIFPNHYEKSLITIDEQSLITIDPKI